MRLFIAINLNEETKRQLIAFRDELRSNSQYGNFSKPENLHLTLVFLGECSPMQTATVKSVMNNVHFEPFELTIEGIGRFRRDGGDTWWAKVCENKSLSDLHRNLTDRLIAAGFSLDRRKFSPHITLGREVVTDFQPKQIAAFGETVSSIELMKSERINGKLTYTVIHRNGASK